MAYGLSGAWPMPRISVFLTLEHFCPNVAVSSDFCYHRCR